MNYTKIESTINQDQNNDTIKFEPIKNQNNVGTNQLTTSYITENA